MSRFKPFISIRIGSMQNLLGKTKKYILLIIYPFTKYYEKTP